MAATTVATVTLTPVTLILDVREVRLCEALGRLGVSYKTAALDVGDILLQNSEGDPLLVIERKSHADFAASNQDGRYREQRARLLAVRGSGVGVLYILEGLWAPSDATPVGCTRLTLGQLKRLVTRLTLRYGLSVLITDSINDTARWCQTLVDQLTADPTVFQPDSEGAATNAMTGFTAALSTVKKANKTADSTAAAMLGAVPGLGPKRVTALLAVKSIAELAALSATEIGDLVIGGKKLGAKVGETLKAGLQFRS
jgi:ERCC4-type nuclease